MLYNQNNLTLDMWVNSDGKKVKETLDRINNIKLSSFAEEIFINTLFTIAKLPNQNMTDEEFINYKFNWLIKNNKDDLIWSLSLIHLGKSLTCFHHYKTNSIQ